MINSCNPVVTCNSIPMEPTKDPSVVALQGQICAIQAYIGAGLASERDLLNIKGALESHAAYAATHFADRCTLESLQASLSVQKENLSKTLQYVTANHQALAARTEKLAEDSKRSDSLIWAWVAGVEGMLQQWLQFETFRMTEVTAKISEASCRAETDAVTVGQLIAAVNLQVPATVTNALTGLLNMIQSFTRGVDLRILRNREFITNFAWGSWGGYGGLGLYGFGGPGFALVGAFGIL